MQLFRVTFHKLVSDDTGHDQTVLQHQVVIPATSAASALATGQAMFCEAEGIVDWRLRADASKVSEVPEAVA